MEERSRLCYGIEKESLYPDGNSGVILLMSWFSPRFVLLFTLAVSFLAHWTAPAAERLSLENSTIVVRAGSPLPGEAKAAVVLREEVEKRTGLAWPVDTRRPTAGTAIVLDVAADSGGRPIAAEGYHLRVQDGAVYISGIDGRGLLYGVGKFLRILDWGPGRASIPSDVDIHTAPRQAIRGHQIAYRSLANSYDAWSPAFYEQYIRELALFGANSIENIPLSGSGPHQKTPPAAMNRHLSQLCIDYDLDYWVYSPVTFDATDEARRAAFLADEAALYADTPRITHIFVPGGDPGENHPSLLFPLMAEMADRLRVHHPEARIWVSMQNFDDEKVDYVFDYLSTHDLPWFGGLVDGPGSPYLPDTRKRLPGKYRFRDYPDITHSCRAQYPVSWWDPALARTLGREGPNPQPDYQSLIQNWAASWTDGFVSYSEGAHDDINKVIWNAIAWAPGSEPREVLVEYARFYFGPELAERGADAILALEQNWVGPLARNGAVESTLSVWEDMTAAKPELAKNWRWQLCLLRAKYDAFIRRRVLHERGLEGEANTVLARSESLGADAAMDEALAILARVDTQPIAAALRGEIAALCDDLFASLGLQTSVEKYQAAGLERGAILDYLDQPMNNRHWLEDNFSRIRSLSSEAEKLAALKVIYTWESPGPGSFYDDLGTLDRSAHLVRGEALETDPLMRRNPNPGFWKWEEGFNRLRLSSLVSMDHPIAVVYEEIDPGADYEIRVTGYRIDTITVNGVTVKPKTMNEANGAIVSYPVPKDAIATGRLQVTWGDPELTEIWLIKDTEDLIGR